MLSKAGLFFECSKLTDLSFDSYAVCRVELIGTNLYFPKLNIFAGIRSVSMLIAGIKGTRKISFQTIALP